jgi:hypothetical protein
VTRSSRRCPPTGWPSCASGCCWTTWMPAVARRSSSALAALRASGATIDGDRPAGTRRTRRHQCHRRLLRPPRASPGTARLLAAVGDQPTTRGSHLRIRRGATMGAADYIDLLHARADWITASGPAGRIGMRCCRPTVPIVAPADRAHWRREPSATRPSSASTACCCATPAWSTCWTAARSRSPVTTGRIAGRPDGLAGPDAR